jgi:hypothetical protein
LPINESLRDDMLYLVSRSDPWYADIVNFIVTGYVPLGETRGSSSMRVVFTYGMIRTSSEFVQMGYSEDVYQLKKESKS